MPLTPQQETAVYDRGGSFWCLPPQAPARRRFWWSACFPIWSRRLSGGRLPDHHLYQGRRSGAAGQDRPGADPPGGGPARGQPPAAADAAGVSGGHQNRGCLLRRTAPRERASAAPSGGAQPDPGFPGAGRTGGHAAAAAGAGPGIGGFLRPHRGGRQRPPAGGDPGSRTG